MFESSETNTINGTKTEEGLFHVCEHQNQKAATEGHFMLLFPCVVKILTMLEDIINYQNLERKQENIFGDPQNELYNLFFYMTLLGMMTVAAKGV